MYSAIIVDDEIPSRDELKFLLSNQDKIKIINECDNGITALKMIKNLQPDIVFLDIQMPEKSGIEVAEDLLKGYYIPIIIFVTAYESYAIKAFEVSAMDYLLKPIEKNRLEITLDKVNEKLISKQLQKHYFNELNLLLKNLKTKENSYERMISIYKDGKYFPIASSEIIYIKVEGKYTVIVTKKSHFIIQKTLSDIESIFSKYSFFKCHRSYIVNINYIETIDLWFNGTYQIKMKYSEDFIPVSRGKAKIFRQIMHII